MVSGRSCLILGLLLLSMACTKATPDFEVLDDDTVPRPKFAGSYLKSLQTYSDVVTFPISGECDPKIRTITGVALGTASASSWSVNSIAVEGINLKCSTEGKFSFELKSLSSLGYAPTEGSVFEVQLRAETAGGTSKASSIKILFSASAGANPPMRISAGGLGALFATGGTLSASVRVTHPLNGSPSATQTQGEEAFLKTDGTSSGLKSLGGPGLHF